jgi:outer membrane protein, heavy metal efflux system
MAPESARREASAGSMENALKALVTALLAVVPALSGCATSYERQTRSALDAHPRPAASRDDQPTDLETSSANFDGSLAGYVGHATAHNPELRARYDEWEAAVDGIDAKRRLPEPQLRYTAYLRHIETRVGPQRHKLGFTQAFPWPTKLSAAAASASLAAQAAEKALDGDALKITQQVATSYWQIWLVDRDRRVLSQQDRLLDALEQAAQARLEIGSATLADATQVSLRRSRLSDRIAGLSERRRQHEASLRRALSVSAATELPVADTAPEVALPRESDPTLRAAARAHPRLEVLELMAASKVEAAESASADGLPGFSVGMDWIETGAAAAPGVNDSGKDAVLLHVGVSVPIWRHVYGAEEDQARSQSRALLARRDAARDDVVSAIDRALSQIRDAHRRVKLYRSTLLPQAETVVESTLGGYQVGEVGLAPVLLGQEDLLEIQLELHRAQVDHAIAWAALEALVGRKVAARGGDR